MEEDKTKGKRALTKVGRPRIFETPDDMVKAFQQYMDWVENNPFKEEKIFQYEGSIVKGETSKLRPLTILGFCIFCDISDVTFYKNYAENPEFISITTRIRNIIEDQQFEGAAAGFFNSNIIARKLGLSDKTETTIKEQPLFGDDGE